MSADWLAAGPRGRKNPEPGQRIVLFVFSSSSFSPTLLRLSSPASAPSSSYSTSGRAGTSSFLAVLLRKISSGGSTRLRVLLLHFPAACSQRHSSFSGDRSILCAFPPSSLSGSLSSDLEAPYFFSNKILSLHQSRLLCAWSGVVGRLSLPPISSFFLS